MKDIEDLLEYGLPQIGEQVRPVDLTGGVVRAARGIRRRRVLASTAGMLAALALAVPVTAVILDGSSEDGRPGNQGDVSTTDPSSLTPSPTKKPSANYDMFGPDGYGRVKLGMPLAEAMATGDLEILPGTTSACTVTRLIPRSDEGVTVLISNRFGVVAIQGANIEASTPEGIRLYSTAAEFKRAYPTFRQDLRAMLSAPVPGHPKARYIAPLIATGGSDAEWSVVELYLVRSVHDPCLDLHDLTDPAESGTGG